MIQKLKAFWASLPHIVQAGVVLFITTVATTLAHSIEDGIVPHTWTDAKHLLGTAVVAGVIAVRAFYMLPNGTGRAALQMQQEQQQVPK